MWPCCAECVDIALIQHDRRHPQLAWSARAVASFTLSEAFKTHKHCSGGTGDRGRCFYSTGCPHWLCLNIYIMPKVNRVDHLVSEVRSLIDFLLWPREPISNLNIALWNKQRNSQTWIPSIQSTSFMLYCCPYLLSKMAQKGLNLPK